ncbi:Protein FAM83G Protein associated with SMAD1 [Larimichthys crocea]|uniref:Protein FAM83G Protein associated with SMAD1 n=1 Tax=Larimichthys crocea TaxID=215358 RepID=A0A6G0J9G9_LARCR|nr:Protein FAM83G Protein associated with SMAD1 [Larimichthys crocea]
MALSQIQCLDDHHVNWRVSESKPEFFYSEDQRLAVEALINKGRDAFTDYIHKHGVREFLSEPELEKIAHRAEAYRPGHEQHHHQKTETPGPGNLTPGSGVEGEDGNVSLQYWPDRSEASVAELDLGWPDAISYRGVTRVTVHTQPPADGHTHIKEVVRKSIASAQKVIAVVMDVFTDVDIFRDLLDAAYKRRVPVYIMIDMAAVPCFLSMCGRADMHRGHLKNLRVRCCGGVEFFTRSAQKVRGSLSQKFLLVDGDRAISGSYSFTWSSSRLDRNLITVITGQAVETFDLQFRELYLLSRSVSLNKVPMDDEPIPDPLPQAAPAPVSAAIARKLINPKYALVATGTHTSPASSDQNSSNKNSQNPTGLKITKGRLRNVIEERPLHPGLAHLEKAYLIPYLPTWPEPDPPSDVIGFINIRDDKRANQGSLTEPTDNAKQTPEPPQTVAPPVPKRRTLQLIIDPAASEQPGQPQVTLMKMDQSESLDGFSEKKPLEELTPSRSPLTSKDDGRDSGSNEGGSQDSTKVICDRGTNDDPSSTSTVSEEEFYDCKEPRDILTNGVTTGSGRGNRHGDGVNMMARLSQSMLDLREPSQSEDSASLIRQSQQLRRQLHASPHRHIGQLFQTSRSPGRDARNKGAKVVIAKPGSYHRPTRASGPVIGGHRYWQGQTLQPDSVAETRSGRSPRRHSPNYRKTEYMSSQQPAGPSGLLGVSFSKLSNLKHLRARGDTAQKKASQNNKATR